MQEIKVKKKEVYIIFKRIADLLFSSILIALISPFLFLIALVILIDTGLPIIYKSKRTGYKNKTMYLLKFRTMYNGADKGSGTTSQNDERITKSGHLLRKFKIDEIPQLFNIFIGNMSFVGPRPELPKWTKLYDAYEKITLFVKPGVSDLASIKFRNLSYLIDDKDPDGDYFRRFFKEKNKLRIKYVENFGLFLDIKIIIKTIKIVLTE